MKPFAFGDNPKMADELLDLVLQGRKTATSWAAAHRAKGETVGSRMTIMDGQNRPRVVIEVTELRCLPFKDVDAAFAHEEGEGNRSLAYWRKEHQEFFTREGTFSDDMKVYCQRFKVVEVVSV